MNTPPRPDIRAYQSSDQPAVVDLWFEAFGTPAPHNDYPKILAEKARQQPEGFFVATIGDELVGTAMCGWDGHRGWVYSVATHTAYRRSGIGRALMDHVEEYLREQGCPKLNLQVRAGNEEVVAFYEKLGYLTEERVSLGKIL